MVFLIFIVINSNQSKPLTILSLLTLVGSAIECHFNLGIQHLPFKVDQDILKMLSSDIDASASIGSIDLKD